MPRHRPPRAGSRSTSRHRCSGCSMAATRPKPHNGACPGDGDFRFASPPAAPAGDQPQGRRLGGLRPRQLLHQQQHAPAAQAGGCRPGLRPPSRRPIRCPGSTGVPRPGDSPLLGEAEGRLPTTRAVVVRRPADRCDKRPCPRWHRWRTRLNRSPGNTRRTAARCACKASTSASADAPRSAKISHGSVVPA